MKKFLLAIINFSFLCCSFEETACYQIKLLREDVSEEDASSSKNKKDKKDKENANQTLDLFFNGGAAANGLDAFGDSLVSFSESDPNSAKTSQTNVYDDVAKRLAGIYIPNDALGSQSRVDYANFVEKSWLKLEESSLSKIKEWAATNIAPRLGEANAVFYPFGGPDIAYALRFFPKAQTYVLLGLEPIGSFDDIKKNVDSEGTFIALKEAASWYLEKGYFITSQMATQLSNRNIRGVLYLMLIELVKSGYTITLVEDLSIDAEGQEVPRQIGAVDCVKITFAPNEGGAAKTAYYIRCNLLDSNRKLSNLFNFVKRLKFATFIKSASYVLHDKSASKMKNFILENSAAILQDDTGVPFKSFDAKWDKYVFGEYDKPTLPIFDIYQQKDLADYFKSQNPAKIPFKIGYGFNKERPNLTLAVPTRRDGEGCPCKNNQTPPPISSSSNEAKDPNGEEA
ncbi:MAG: hypothetical protein LBL99_02145 [Holosporaceae bacterium]|jgi:hypothetical protein|nr:hypothetical protein [Holosporaceae bacterium]